MYQSERAGDETKTRKSPAKSGRVGITDNALLRIECARILQERGLGFQISGLFTSGSFNRD